jgi:hypothetical protein
MPGGSLRPFERWAVLGLAGVFLLLGALFVAMPMSGARLFGIEVPQAEGLSYVRAIGFRDLVLALYIAALALWTDRRALGIVLALTTAIPVLDLGLILWAEGLSSPPHLVLHGASAAVFAGLAIWVRRGGS